MLLIILYGCIYLGHKLKSMLSSVNPNPTLLKFFCSTWPRCKPCEKLLLPSLSSMTVPFLLKIGNQSCRPPPLIKSNPLPSTVKIGILVTMILPLICHGPSYWHGYSHLLAQLFIIVDCCVFLLLLHNDPDNNDNDNDLVGNVCRDDCSN